MNATLLWTSPQFQNWKTDCTKCIASDLPFEVRDVYQPEQEQFCISLCGQHGYAWKRQNRSILCSPAVPTGEVAPVPVTV